MIFTPLPLQGAFRIDLERREDDRGFFARMFCSREFANLGFAGSWAQINTTYSRRAGTVRGMHFQRQPMAEVKVVKCLRGAIYDVLVDLRKGSDTFGHWTGLDLTSDNRSMAYVPKGFAHGFQTLVPNVELLYLHDTAYSAAHEAGVTYADPDLAINWPLPIADLSGRDSALPRLASVEPVAL
jgi:dTDP-4-dehydrorhamnose 3,5-epimerase